MGTITLNGNQSLLTANENISYLVADGFVLIYLLPINAQKQMRRQLIGRGGAGFVIPSLYRTLDWNGKPFQWRLLLLPDESAQLQEIPAEESHRSSFLQGTGLCGPETNPAEVDFGAYLAGLYTARHEKTAAQIHSRVENRRASAGQIIGHMRTALMGKAEERIAQTTNTGENLYDAISFLCHYRRVPIAPIDSIHDSCGTLYSVQDIARLSGFVCRKIDLSENWHRQENEAMLCFLGEGMQPIVCYPKMRRRMMYWNPADDSFGQVDEQTAQRIASRAFIISRPLPDTAITIREVTAYAVREFSLHDVIVMLIATLMATFVNLQFSRLSEVLYDTIIPQGSYSSLYGYGFLMVAYMIGGVCYSITKGIAGFRLNSRIKYSLQSAIYDRLFHLPESFFRGHEHADLAYRASMLADSYVAFFNNAMQIILMVLFSTIYLQRMYRYSAVLSNIGIAFIAAGVLVSVLMGWLLQRLQRQRVQLTGGMRSFLFQTFSGINTIRSSGAEDSALNEYMKKYTRMTTLELKTSSRQRISSAISTLISALSVVALYYAVSSLNTGLSVGGFMGFTSAHSAFSASMMQVGTCALSIFIMMPMMKNSIEILNLPPERADRGFIPRNVKGDIHIANVSFGYGNSRNTILQNIDLHIQPGEYIAFVGASGCGKSTLLRLLLGFEHPRSGKIYYDGVDLDRINKPELRRKMGVVLQDGVLFSGTIYRNIRIARPTATQEDVLSAVAAVDLEKDIAQMPLGLQTLVSEQAQTISGGQKQRILLARAIIGNPRILILDEATSALDNITQAKVCENLAKLGTTRIVVAHRLSTVMQCDRIVVLNDGRIAEVGSYQQLMDNKGLFYQLARMQAL